LILDEKLGRRFLRCETDSEVSLQVKTYADYEGDGAFLGDVIYSVDGTLVDSIALLRSVREDLKTTDAVALQVEGLGLHYLVLETDRRADHTFLALFLLRKPPGGGARSGASFGG
jgi:hypothetical protein